MLAPSKQMAVGVAPTSKELLTELTPHLSRAICWRFFVGAEAAATPVKPEPSPVKAVAVTVPADKFPLASRFTMVFGVFAVVAAFARSSAAWTLAAVEPPTLATTVVSCEPVTSPARLPVKLAALPLTLPVTLPESGPLKLPVVVPPKLRFKPSCVPVILPSARVRWISMSSSQG